MNRMTGVFLTMECTARKFYLVVHGPQLREIKETPRNV